VFFHGIILLALYIITMGMKERISGLFRFIIVLVLLLSLAGTGNAAFITTKKATAAHHTRTAQAVAEYRSSHPIISLLEGLFPHNTVPLPANAPDDSYKGILAIAFSGAGLLMLGVALAAASVGFIFPAFLFGVAGIVFGSIRKKKNKGLGRAGLIIGIIDVVLVLLFITAVVVALSAFK